jgi:hypothetical protein
MFSTAGPDFDPQTQAMNAVAQSDGDAQQCESMRAELLLLRRIVAQRLGRQQHFYEVLDAAIETPGTEALERAKAEFEQLPDEIKQTLAATL